MSTPPPLFACVLAREFPAQAMLRLRPELRRKPCAVLDGISPLESVCALNSRARALGITHGTTRTELETFSAVAILKRSPAEEKAAQAALLECAGTFSPRVEDRTHDATFCCVLDISGTEKLLGSPGVLARSLEANLHALGVYGAIAVSTSFYTALCLARGHAHTMGLTLAPAGYEADSLALLPLSVLDLTQEQTSTFSLWGIRTLGTLAALPEKDLIARMGQPGKRLRQIARGEHPHHFQPVEPRLVLEESRELDTPVEALDSLLFVVRVLLEQIILRASLRALALAAVTITLTLERGEPLVRTVRPALPTNDSPLWLKLLQLDLEAHSPQAAILALTLHADPGSTSKLQLGLFSPQLPEAIKLDVTLARIRAIVGEENAGRAVLSDTHQEDQHILQPFSVTHSTQSHSTPTTPRVAARQLRPAEVVQVLLKDTQPQTFTFRTQRYTVQHAYGPWRSSGDWWNGTQSGPQPWNTEQWDLIARAHDGSLLCCCMLHQLITNRWQVAALYD